MNEVLTKCVDCGQSVRFIAIWSDSLDTYRCNHCGRVQFVKKVKELKAC